MSNPNGQLLPKGTMLLRKSIGTAKLGKVEYEMTLGVNGAPLIKNEATGKTFAFAWQDLIDQARAAGIDQADPAPTADELEAARNAGILREQVRGGS